MVKMKALSLFFLIPSALALGSEWPVLPIAELELHSEHFSTSGSTVESTYLQEYPAYNFSCPVDHFHNISRYVPYD